MSEARDKGLALFREVYGDEMADGAVAHGHSTTDFGPEQVNWTFEWAFGSVWAREGLQRKLRSCAVLGMLIGQGQSEEIKAHTIMGLKNGLTRKELEEIFYTAIPYAGFPAANTAKTAMLEAFAQMEKASAG
ncbi:MAG: carboxymuconolactone decarboxylase family protein [Novosphingobium sp.]|nr:carboxymuconolactone decarboxylase family protein [Novosphingobium sp.]